jgi:hypothetical protein
MPKKVLIITYYWPPAGGPGVQRWLKFVKYLPENHIEPVLYCPENASYPLIDKTLESEVSSDLKVLKQNIKEPYKLASLFTKQTKTISKGIISDTKNQSFIEKLLLYIRGNYFIPDARKNWIKPSVDYLKPFLEQHQIETIITTGPPHSLHLIGLQLKKELNLNWIADFRDPWTTIGYHKKLKLTKKASEKHLKLESEVLTCADKIIVTSYNTKREFSAKTAQPIAVITNGFDNEVLTDITLDKCFSLAHIGSLLSDRNPKILWQVLSELIKDHKSFASNFKLNLVGAVGKGVLESIKAYGLEPYTNYVGYVSHDEAILHQHKSQVLLLIEIDSEDTKAIIPGKLFEYFNANRPILAIGPDSSDVESLIHQTQTGHYYLYNEKEALKQRVLNYFNLFLNNELSLEASDISRFSRSELTKQLAKFINQ